MSEKTYLGDSVYVDREDGMIVLTTDNGYPDDPRNQIYSNKIYMEPSVVEALMKYLESVGHEKHEKK